MPPKKKLKTTMQSSPMEARLQEEACVDAAAPSPNQRSTERNHHRSRSDEPQLRQTNLLFGQSSPRPQYGVPRDQQGGFGGVQTHVSINVRDPNLAQIALDNRRVLPGLLLTRPDARPEAVGYKDGDNTSLDQRTCPKLRRTRVRVIDTDTIDAALILMAQKGAPSKPVCILNMANAFRAGGGWLQGCRAQEEQLCYRTSLSATLHRQLYPIPPRGGIYSPNVLVIRESSKNGLAFLDCREPKSLQLLSAVSVAAVNTPQVSQDARGRPAAYLDPAERDLMMEKIRVILRIASKNGHQQIVLGAFGCGAFRNPPKVVARIFKIILTEPEFSGGWWLDVVFAVLDGGTGNVAVFQKELDGHPV